MHFRRGISTGIGYVEKRKKYRWKGPWTMAEWGNWVTDGIAGRARKMAEIEEKEWAAAVDKWNAEVDRRERMGGIAKAVAKPQFVQGRCPYCCQRRNWRTACSGGVVLGRLLEVT
jgi:hypothetical protein